MTYSVVLTTTANKDDAREIASILVRDKLAACVQLIPIDSVYFWEGEVQDDPEVLLYIKTKREHYQAIEAAIQKHHKYDVPEVVLLPIEAGSKSYLGWIDEVVK